RTILRHHVEGARPAVGLVRVVFGGRLPCLRTPQALRWNSLGTGDARSRSAERQFPMWVPEREVGPCHHVRHRPSPIVSPMPAGHVLVTRRTMSPTPHGATSL